MLDAVAPSKGVFTRGWLDWASNEMAVAHASGALIATPCAALFNNDNLGRDYWLFGLTLDASNINFCITFMLVYGQPVSAAASGFQPRSLIVGGPTPTGVACWATAPAALKVTKGAWCLYSPSATGPIMMADSPWVVIPPGYSLAVVQPTASVLMSVMFYYVID